VIGIGFGQTDPPSFWFVIIPEIVYELGRPQSRVARADAIAGSVTISKKKAEGFKIAPSLFAEEHEGADVYEYATHFRRQLKARLLKSKIVTQIVRETTLSPEDFTKANGMPLRRWLGSSALVPITKAADGRGS
jgi:hypothetical protein